jgi:DNA-binding transcriptional ArsR family regulator
VIGPTRATILTQLDLPMSTDHLAVQLDLAAPTVNVHLKALREAGILTSRRAGRHVLYRRTPLGDQLQAAAT